MSHDEFAMPHKVPIPSSVFRKLGRSPKNFGVYTVIGDSMEPTAPDGSMALVDLNDTVIRGSVYAISIDGDARIKRLKKRATGEIEIISDNEIYETEVLSGEQLNFIKIIGRVRWLGRWL